MCNEIIQTFRAVFAQPSLPQISLRLFNSLHIGIGLFTSDVSVPVKSL